MLNAERQKPEVEKSHISRSNSSIQAGAHLCVRVHHREGNVPLHLRGNESLLFYCGLMAVKAILKIHGENGANSFTPA